MERPSAISDEYRPVFCGSFRSPEVLTELAAGQGGGHNVRLHR
jgi:hypothetical protein